MAVKKRILNHSLVLLIIAAPTVAFLTFTAYLFLNELFLFISTLDDWIYYLILTFICISLIPFPPLTKKRAIMIHEFLTAFWRKFLKHRFPQKPVINEPLNIINSNHEDSKIFSQELTLPSYLRLPNFDFHRNASINNPKALLFFKLPFHRFFRSLKHKIPFLFHYSLPFFSHPSFCIFPNGFEPISREEGITCFPSSLSLFSFHGGLL